MIAAPYACHNKARERATYDVQDGWVNVGLIVDGIRVMTRLPRMKKIMSVGAVECQYTKGALTDPRCAGCVWQAVAAEALPE